MSLSSRAYKILCARYRNLITRQSAKSRTVRARSNVSCPWSGLEPLEPRVLLSASPVDLEVTDFAVFGSSSVNLGKDVLVVEGAVGSNGNVSIDKDAQTQNIYGNGQLSLAKDAVVDGSIVFNGPVTIEKDSLIQGDVDAVGRSRSSSTQRSAGPSSPQMTLVSNRALRSREASPSSASRVRSSRPRCHRRALSSPIQTTIWYSARISPHHWLPVPTVI